VTNTAVSSAVANQRWADVATELTDSLSRSGKGAMLAPLQGYAGNATLPGYTFGNDTNVGLYLIGADNLGLSIGGTKRWDFAAAGTSLTGTFDVSGATSLASTLTVRGAAAFSDPVSITDALTVTSTATFSDPVTVGTATSSQHAATKGLVEAPPTLAAPTMAANWTTGAADAAVRYWKDHRGVVRVMGTATRAAGGADVFTLPAGFRPLSARYGNTPNVTTGAAWTWTINASTGWVSVSGGTAVAGEVYSFDGVSVLAEQ
jgi:hypothetical protein